ncbi:MAG: hypothetical protein AAF727_04495 [Pseudomonadota bacterium]
MTQHDRAQAQERVYARRARRTRLSKWLGGVVLSVVGMGLMLVMRLNPELTEDLIAMSNGTHVPEEVRVAERPEDLRVRAMPSDAVPVRRGGGSTFP